MQTNLHRVSEFAVTANQTADDSNLEARTSVKRVRELDTETESDADDIVSSSTIPGALSDLSSHGIEATDFWLDSSKSEGSQLDTTVFLSFDWDNEQPYERAVERYYSSNCSIFSRSITLKLECCQFSIINANRIYTSTIYSTLFHVSD